MEMVVDCPLNFCSLKRQVDASLVSEGQDADATREYVAELVTQQMQCEGFQLMPEQVPGCACACVPPGRVNHALGGFSL